MEIHEMVYAGVLRAVAASGGMQAPPQALAAELNHEFSTFGIRLRVLDLQTLRTPHEIAELLARKIH